MGGASRLLMLLTTSLPTLFLRHPLPRRLLTTTTINLNRHRLRPLLPSIKCSSSSSSLHTQSLYNNSPTISSYPYSTHPWPEWSQLINTLLTSPTSTTGQGFSAAEKHAILPEDAFVAYEEKELSSEFVKAASALLAFAHHQPNLLGQLSRRNIEVVVSNGTPFLFKTALETARKMRAFLGVDGANVLESDKASTVDLVKYILSYASNPIVTSERSNTYSRELVESSVRNLLRELIEMNWGTPALDQPAGVQDRFPGRCGRTPGHVNQNIVMKRGDWICPKCNFMNFARNVKCPQCEESRPKRQLTGGEWECPQCDFFNYGRNTVCLRCDCKKPDPAPIDHSNSISESGYNGNTFRSDSKLAENEEKSRENASHLSNAATDEDLPEIMPLRKGENKFVVSTRKTPLERHLAKAPEGKVSQHGGGGDDLDTSIRQSLDRILGRSAPGSPKKDQTVMENLPSFSVSGESFQVSEKQGSKDIALNKETEEADKSKRWFEKMAELHNVKDLPSAVSDEDFPEMMPMRKGENRFVVSKKKDRSLTSPPYKRQMAMEQANNPKYVPFVPFPPGYFASKDTQPAAKPDSSVEPADQMPTSSMGPEGLPSGLNNALQTANNVNPVGQADNEQPSSTLGNSFSGDNRLSFRRSSNQSSSPVVTRNSGELNTSQPKSYAEGLPRESLRNKATTQSFDFARGSTSVNSGAQNTPHSRSPSRDSLQLPADQNVRSGWTGKSLEGSAVKEPDPLDMSEEAKAERWFRRVAQIKDINELSQIPDEDFPSIMPMRKGVNRFVVSKRKTPLERRLTSPQYRRNLPVVSSDPIKHNDNNNEIK